MAIGIGTPVEDGGDGDASFAVNCAGDDRLLLVGCVLSDEPDDITGITYDSDALTEFPNSPVTDGGKKLSVWYKVAPSSGSNTLAVNQDGGNDLAVGALPLTGVHQSSTFGTDVVGTGDSDTPSVTVGSAVGDLVVDFVGQEDTNPAVVLNAGSGQTQRIDIESFALDNTGAQLWVSTEAGAAPTVVMDGTFPAGAQTWVMLGVSVKPAAVAANSPYYSSYYTRVVLEL